MAFRRLYKNKIVLTLFDDSGETIEHVAHLFVPTIEESSMLSFLFRRSLHHRIFSVHQDYCTPMGFKAVSEPERDKLCKTREAFAELERNRRENAIARLIVTLPDEKHEDGDFTFEMYFHSLTDSDIAYTLLSEATRTLKKKLVSEAKDKQTGEWEEREPGMFIYRDVALAFISLNPTNKDKAIKFMKELKASEQK